MEKLATYKLREHKECNTPEQVAAAWHKKVATQKWFDPSKEHLIAFLLNNHRNLVGFNLCFIGSSSECMASPRDIVRPAVVLNVSRIVVAHNHPSGNCTPSDADLRATRRLAKASELLGIELEDHVIIGFESSVWPDGYYSFRESGLL